MRCFNGVTKVATSIFVLTLASSVIAKDFGVHGQTFEVKEPDMLDVIMNKLKDPKKIAEIKAAQVRFKAQSMASTKRPKPVGLPKTAEPRRFTYTPVGRFNEDLKDREGRVFYKAHTPVNPLTRMSLEKPLFFFDGDDVSQVKLAEQYHQSETGVMLILTSGAPFELNEHFKTEVYFDQGGFISRQLGIEQVPALVTQQDAVLMIEEILV